MEENENKFLQIFYGDNGSGKTLAFNELKRTKKEKEIFISIDDLEERINTSNSSKTNFYSKDYKNFKNKFCFFLEKVLNNQENDNKSKPFTKIQLAKIISELMKQKDYIETYDLLNEFKDEFLMIPIRAIDEDKYLNIWKDENLSRTDKKQIIIYIIKTKIKETLDDLRKPDEWKDFFTYQMNVEELNTHLKQTHMFKVLNEYTLKQIQKIYKKLFLLQLSYDRDTMILNSIKTTINLWFKEEFKNFGDIVNKIKNSNFANECDKLISKILAISGNSSKGYTLEYESNVLKDISRGQKTIILTIAEIVEKEGS